MRREVSLPEELVELDGKISYICRISYNELSSTCFRCGGERHQNGEYPDRFRIWIKSKATGAALGWCRRCGAIWMPHGEKLDPEAHSRWIEERKVYEQETKTKVEYALGLLKQEQAWVTYNQNLSGELRHYYYKRGIDDFWIAYWMLGYNPAKVVWTGKQEYTTPTLTIPIFLPREETPLTIRNRLLEPKDHNDKYRPEFGNLPSGLFITNRDQKPTGKAVVIEGEFKSMTTSIVMDSLDYHVVGVPGKTPNLEMLSLLDDCEVVYLLLDPDAFNKPKNGISPMRRMVEYFKDRSRVIRVPEKIDDMLLSKQLSKVGLFKLIKGARRIK